MRRKRATVAGAGHDLDEPVLGELEHLVADTHVAEIAKAVRLALDHHEPGLDRPGFVGDLGPPRVW